MTEFSAAFDVPPILPTDRIESALSEGLRAHGAGRWPDAIAFYDRALALAPDHVAALVNKGAALRRLDRLEPALACYWQAIAIEPDRREAWSNAASALLQGGRDDEARALLGSLLDRDPRFADGWLNLARLLQRKQQRPAAEACLRRALALRPNDGVARLALARLLRQQHRLEPALAEFSRLCALAPRDGVVSFGHAEILIDLARHEAACSWLERALQLDPTLSEARRALSRVRISTGGFAAGWSNFADSLQSSRPAEPADWDGSDPRGQSVLVTLDLLIEDTLLLLRFVTILAERGADITLAGPEPLLSQLRPLLPQVRLLAAGAARPAIDQQCRLSQLPLLLGDAIPDFAPYLSAPLSAPLAAPIGTVLKVGIAWVGDRDRPIGLEALLPTLGVARVAFYSLQSGRPAGEIKKLAHPTLLRDLSPQLGTLSDALSVIARLDLVIAADGPIAHLAGALGKPVWNLIPFAAPWRWPAEGELSEWYPSMRLFRQPAPGDWGGAVRAVVEALCQRAAEASLPAAETAEIRVNAIFPDQAGQPRFRMVAPRAHLADPGIRYLVNREISGVGYEYATRSFIDAHLQPDDLFLDVGAHWGIMALQAATRWPGRVQVLAFEPLRHNLPYLSRWITDNDAQAQIEVIGAAVSDRPGHGRLKPESTMGHSLVKTEEGPIAVVTIDQMLAERPALANRRVLVKIDVEGSEGDVVAGMQALLETGRVAAVIWERGIEYDRPEGRKRQTELCRRFAALGFTAWYFASEDQAGALLPFDDDETSSWHGNVFQLAPGLPPRGDYGLPRPATITQPRDEVLLAALRARSRFNRGFELQTEGKVAEAAALYGEAAALDSGVPGLWNNLGVLLRDSKRLEAAAACYRRALAAAPQDTSVMSNLGNALRDLGRLDQALAIQSAALCLQPGQASLLYNAGVAQKDACRPELALPLFERALLLDQDNADYRWDRALVLLQLGNYAAGFAAYETRWNLKRAHKRKITLPRWDGSPLAGRSITLTDEQGFGDVLQFARFIPEVKRRGAGHIVLECQPELMRLMALTASVDQVIPREKGVLDSDFALPLLSLPGLFGISLDRLPANVPYLRAPQPARRLSEDGRRKIGLVWAGKPTPRDRSCPLDLLLPLLGDPGTAVFSLQVGPRAADLKNLGADAFITDLAPMLQDFADTAAMLTQLDLLITVDTSVAHLAGALAVPTALLLRYTSDWRWFDRARRSPWYPTMTLFRQHAPNDWGSALKDLAVFIAE